MTRAVVHRGPDGFGVWSNAESRIALGHVRLAVTDLSTIANQPMISLSGRTCIVFNGEIYNHIERRAELEAEGFRFKSDSDTEVILALYERYGLGCVQFLRGMFAFALYDLLASRLILARDRMGKKPLYYCQTRNSFYFGSEIKAILAGLGSTPSADPEALDEYLTFGFIGGERTIYQGIKELQPGSVMVLASPTDRKCYRYWQPRWEPKGAISFVEAVSQVEKMLTEAVRLRLRSDVPVGIFLSGGLDSSLITAIASRNIGGRCLTFTVGFKDGAFDERPRARRIADQYSTDHVEVLVEPDILSLIPQIVWHYDEPFADASAIPCFAIAAIARKHVKVVLNGDGGDELFGGYRRYLAVSALTRIRRAVPLPILCGVAGAAVHCLPSPGTVRSLYALLHRFLQGLSADSIEGLLTWFTNGFIGQEKSELYHVRPSLDQARLSVEEIMVSTMGLDYRDCATALDVTWALPGDMLVKMDVATMAYGLEARSPFLDQELVDWAMALPLSVRLHGWSTKPLLRHVASRYLPPAVAQAPKQGFEVPLYRWLKEDLREMCHDLVLSQDGIVSTMFRRARVEHLLRDCRPNPARWTDRVWILFMLAAWDRYRFRA